MATRLAPKELAKQPERLAPGHRLCAGCGASIIVRQMLAAIDDPVVLANATGCLEVATTIYPYTAWRVPWIHNAFENAASTISGVEAAYRSMVRQGKIEDQNVKFIAFGGDGECVLEVEKGVSPGLAGRGVSAAGIDVDDVGHRCARADGQDGCDSPCATVAP